jgi:hypothetical protein
MPDTNGPSPFDLQAEVARRKEIAKSLGVSTYRLEGDKLVEERPDGTTHETSGPDNLPCVSKLKPSK